MLIVIDSLSVTFHHFFLPLPDEALRNVELGVVSVDSMELCQMKGDKQTGA